MGNKLQVPEFLANMLEEQYGEQIAKQIIDGYQKQKKVTLRVNTLKTTPQIIKQKLEKENIQVENVTWSKNAFIIENSTENELQKLNIYKNGEIYLQSLSSMLPPIVLEPKEKETILDMTAAPGSKTTQIAAITKNQAQITACEMNNIRAERLKYNIEKQGVNCAYVMVTDARRLNDLFSFDKILLDAPCSGSGTIQLEQSDWQKYFSEKLIKKSCENQLALLKKALKLLKPGKEMVYSTCSILSCENEEIVDKALKGTNASIVPIELEKFENIPILPVKIKGTLCVCPNEYYEGFFVAKIRKD